MYFAFDMSCLKKPFGVCEINEVLSVFKRQFMIFAQVRSGTLGKLRNIFLILVVVNLDYAELCWFGAVLVFCLLPAQ
jgi:hypothetical protein